jgi:hypothetical protein
MATPSCRQKASSGPTVEISLDENTPETLKNIVNLFSLARDMKAPSAAEQAIHLYEIFELADLYVNSYDMTEEQLREIVTKADADA